MRGVYYVVEVVWFGSVLGLGGRVYFGMENMMKWGVYDIINIVYEVGYMFGNVDEYGEVEIGGRIIDYIKKLSIFIMVVFINNLIFKYYYFI